MKVHVILKALHLPHSDHRLFDGTVEAESTVDALREVMSKAGVLEHLSNLNNKSLSCSAKEVRP